MEKNRREFKPGIKPDNLGTRLKGLRKNRRAKLSRMRPPPGKKEVSEPELQTMISQLVWGPDLMGYLSGLHQILLVGVLTEDYFNILFENPVIIKTLVHTLNQPLTVENEQLLKLTAMCVVCISGHSSEDEWVPVLLGHNILDVLSQHLAQRYSNYDFYDSLLMICGNICFDSAKARDLLCSHGIVQLVAVHFDDEPLLRVRVSDFFNTLFVCKPMLEPAHVAELWTKVRPIAFQSNSLYTIDTVYRMLANETYQAILVNDTELLSQLVNILVDPTGDPDVQVSALGGIRQLTMTHTGYMIQHYDVVNLFVRMFMSTSTDVQEAAAGGLATCARNVDISDQLCSPGVFPVFKQMFTRVRVWRITSELLWTVLFTLDHAINANNGQIVMFMCNARMLTHITQVFTRNSQYLKQQALNVVLGLLRFPFIKNYLEESRTISAIEEIAISPGPSPEAEQIMRIIEGRVMDVELDEEIPDIYTF